VGLLATIIDDEAGLEELRGAWDDLAVRAASPFSAPAWAIGWWRHARPRRATLRTVAVNDEDGALVGVAPLYACGRGPGAPYEVMAARLSPPASLLIEPDREPEVCAAMADALRSARPRTGGVRFWDQVPASPIATELVGGDGKRDGWVHVATTAPLPFISIEGLGFEEWIGTLSSKFRQETRRLRRRIDDAEASFELIGIDRVGEAMEAFATLHGSRWEERGGSNALVSGLNAMIAEAAAELMPQGRLRIFTIEAEGRIVAVNLLLAAGGEVCGWNSGFDEDWSRYSPSTLLTLHAVADATERGDRRINLGPGRMGYKTRLADGEEVVAITTVVSRSAAYPLSRLRFAPQQLRSGVSRRLSPEAKRRLARVARR
jgi:CelD/BcsL family acetyltransferase involved in cellulose biosynthesis